MNKKGFTLMEVLGVLIILVIIFLLAYPNIISRMKKAQEKIDKATTSVIIEGSKDFMDNHKDSYPRETNSIYCLTINELLDSGNITNGQIRNLKDKNVYVKVSYIDKETSYEIVDRCQNSISTKPYLTGGSENWKTTDMTLTLVEPEIKGSIVGYEYYISTSNTSLTGGTWLPVDSTKKVIITNNGIHYIYARGVDLGGSGLEVSDTSETTKIDKEGPIFNLEYTNEYVKELPIKVNARDADSGLNSKAYSFDDGETYQASNSYKYTEPGSKTIRVRDKAGNESKQTINITNIDNEGPELVSVKAYYRNEDNTYNTSKPINISIKKVGGIYTYSIANWLGKKNYPYGVSFVVNAKDDAKIDYRTWRVNAHGLTKTITSAVGYSTNSAAYWPAAGQSSETYPNKPSSITIKSSLSAEGSRRGIVTIYDSLGNKTEIGLEVDLDRTAPSTCSITNKKADANSYTDDTWTNTTSVRQTLNSADSLSGVNNISLTYTGATTNRVEKIDHGIIDENGTSYVVPSCVDKAGNVSTGQRYTIKIDNIDPEINYTYSGTKYNDGYLLGAFTVSSKCEDATSGVARFTNTSSGETNTTGAALKSPWVKEPTSSAKTSRECVDKAGNTIKEESTAKKVYKKITLTYAKNGATTIGKTSDTKYTTSNSVKFTMPNITRTSGKIKGWNTSATATTNKYSINASYSFSSNTTLYAITYKVLTAKFDTNNTVSSVTNASNTCETYNTNSSCNVKLTSVSGSNCGDGKPTFWSANKDGTGKNYGNAADNLATTGISYDTTMYASCMPANYTIKYDTNGGSGTIPLTKVTSTATSYTMNVTDLIPTKTNCRFIGWSTTKTNQTSFVKSVKLTSTNTSKTLYAGWMCLNPRLTYEYVSDNGVLSSSIKANTTGTTISKSLISYDWSGGGNYIGVFDVIWGEHSAVIKNYDSFYFPSLSNVRKFNLIWVFNDNTMDAVCCGETCQYENKFCD